MNRLKITFGALLLVLVSTGQLFAAVTVGHLRCEHRENPQGIDATHPRLSWQLSSGERNVKQTAYQILVATTVANLKYGTGDLWDSGTVVSDQSILIPYDGQLLTTRARCFWQVRVWDANDNVSAWSEPAAWTMGVFAPSDWNAKWIGQDGAEVTNLLAGTSWI